jgi:hypothetical protein
MLSAASEWMDGWWDGRESGCVRGGICEMYCIKRVGERKVLENQCKSDRNGAVLNRAC